MNVLEMKNVQKDFGSLQVIQDLSFQVPKNSVFGFIGKNGAGKTTTMKMILGFLKPSSGEISVCGEKVTYGNTKTNRFIGYLPDVPEFYGYMNPKEYLRFCGEITGLPKNLVQTRSEELLRLVGLDEGKRRIQGFSRGMKQRLGIAQALLNEPELLICDEPTSALDPIGRKEILDILSIARDRTTIVFSTHILSDVERISDRIGLLDNGKLVLQGSVSELKNKRRKDIIQIEIGSSDKVSYAAAILKSLPSVVDTSVKDKSILIEIKNAEKTGNEVLGALINESIPVFRFEIQEPSLENIFMEVVR